MKEPSKIWMNGSLVPFQNAEVHVLTHALHYSTAVFDGIRCYDTRKGPAIFRLEDHVERLFRSAKAYSMRMGYTRRQVRDAIIDTVRACGFRECYIRPLAYCGYGEMGFAPAKSRVELSISCWPWKTGESKAGKSSGAKCMVSSWIRVDPRAQPMQAKAAANYSSAALARAEATENGYDEAIILNSDGRVVEGCVENIFICRDGLILTPPLSTGCLDGITRDSVMQVAESDGMDTAERVLYRDDLYAADEVFLTGTAAEVRSVTQVDRARIGTGRMGRITKELQRSFARAVAGRDKRFQQWLTVI